MVFQAFFVDFSSLRLVSISSFAKSFFSGVVGEVVGVDTASEVVGVPAAMT